MTADRHARAVELSAARAIAYDAAAALPPADVSLRDAVGCVLAEPIQARVDLPSFNTAAMDGWAVRGSGPWTLVGGVLAGACAIGELRAGDAVAVATGAAVPAGADAVIRCERGVLREGRVFAEREQARHMRMVGEECQAGTVLLPAGAIAGPAAIGLAAAVGHDTLRVRPRPQVYALITGDELLQRGRPHGTRIRDAIGPMLEPLVAWFGGSLVGADYVPDDGQLLAKAIDAADADVVVTTGASSVGAADFLPFALEELGAQVLVDGVRVRPGHPQALAALPSGQLLIGLPGNPLAALAAMSTLLAAVLAGLAGKPRPRAGVGTLTHDLPAAAHDHRLVPVTVQEGQLTACMHAGSAMLRGAAVAAGLAVIPPGGRLRAGSVVEVLDLPG